MLSVHGDVFFITSLIPTDYPRTCNGVQWQRRNI